MPLACLDSPASDTLKRQTIEKEDISLTGIACYSLSQLKLVSMALELMLTLLYFAVSLANIPPTDYFQIYAYIYITKGDAVRTKKVTDKVEAPKSVDAVTAALCPSISELRGRHSQR